MLCSTTIYLLTLWFLVGNKDDEPERKVVPTSDAQKFSTQINIPFFETSAKENKNVEEVGYRIMHLYTAPNSRHTCFLKRSTVKPETQHVISSFTFFHQNICYIADIILGFVDLLCNFADVRGNHQTGIRR